MILLGIIAIFVFITFAGIGATMIITESYLFKAIRDAIDPKRYPYLAKFVKCPMCVGFWVGMIFQTIVYLMIPINLGLLSIVITFFQGCVTSLFSFIIHIIILKLSKGLKI